MDLNISLKTIFWIPVKEIAQKMFENHINSHQESELKAILNELNIALLRPKGPKKRRKKYNMRNEKIQQRIEILSKLLGIPEAEQDSASFEPFPDGFFIGNSNAVNQDAVDPEAVPQDAVNPDSINQHAADPTLMQ